MCSNVRNAHVHSVFLNVIATPGWCWESACICGRRLLRCCLFYNTALWDPRSFQSSQSYNWIVPGNKVLASLDFSGTPIVNKLNIKIIVQIMAVEHNYFRHWKYFRLTLSIQRRQQAHSEGTGCNCHCFSAATDSLQENWVVPTRLPGVFERYRDFASNAYAA